MTRQPLKFASDEDRKAYRTSMRALACVYGAIIVLTIGGVTLRGHPTSDVAAATTSTIDMANLTKIDRQ